MEALSVGLQLSDDFCVCGIGRQSPACSFGPLWFFALDLLHKRTGAVISFCCTWSCIHRLRRFFLCMPSILMVAEASGKLKQSLKFDLPPLSPKMKYMQATNLANFTAWISAAVSNGAIKRNGRSLRQPLSADGMVIFCSLDAHIYALDAKSGYLIWRFKMDKGSISTPCIADGLVYTGSIDGNIYCINMNNAKEVWRFQTEHQVTGSPTVLEDGLYCGSVDGNLYCLDNQTGHLRWKFKTDKPITGTPVAHDDMIFVGSTNNNFYAVPTKSAS